MTLCTAYIRQVNGVEELVFATDSELTGGGEKWDKGVKLFELPNKDALLCFTGATQRAYPLILNLISSLNYEEQFFKQDYTLFDLKDYVLELFSTLIKSISDYVEDKHKIRGDARFLFGGWDWEQGQFRLWYVIYDEKKESFIANELTDDEERTNFYVFIGEAKDIDVEDLANEELTLQLIEENKLHKKLNMEPLQILRKVALDSKVEGVGGSLQIAKVYRSNKTEFFGAYWPSSEGSPCFQGRKYTEVNKPIVRYFDPDSFELMEMEIPMRLGEINEEDFLDDYEFVRSCYEINKGEQDEQDNEVLIFYLKSDLPEREKIRLRTTFKEMTYRKYTEGEEGKLRDQMGL